MTNHVATLTMHAVTDTGGEIHSKATISPVQWADLVRIAEGRPTVKEAALQAEIDRLKKVWKTCVICDGTGRAPV